MLLPPRHCAGICLGDRLFWYIKGSAEARAGCVALGPEGWEMGSLLYCGEERGQFVNSEESTAINSSIHLQYVSPQDYQKLLCGVPTCPYQTYLNNLEQDTRK
jgi:GMP synthase-like glutamine amidotransferase